LPLLPAWRGGGVSGKATNAGVGVRRVVIDETPPAGLGEEGSSYSFF